MIVGQRKPLDEIWQMIGPAGRVLVAGCGECVSVCHTGGEKEASLLAAELRLKAGAEGRSVETSEQTVLRQCEPEFVEEMREAAEAADVVVSIACGVGAQVAARHFAAVADGQPAVRVLPGLNTTFMGHPLTSGDFWENCMGCGNCIIHFTGGVCPIARCAKNLMNGPCGGSMEGRCEVSPDVPCAWTEIYENLDSQGKLDALDPLFAAKDWSTGADGHPRRMRLPDLEVKR